ncbi:uncharacterized protein LOC134826555 [Bolinopsis microptera]|uniref:uncharacterized protein LOC134826555 n=1 Tax=Bolinopsis microptera TaxID=2820187 RepID=UPI00307A6273
MRSFLVLVLFFVSFENVKGCPNICSFLYSNSNADWENHSSIADTYFIVEGIASGSVTGIITARFETFTPDYGKTFDFLRFHNDNTKKEDNQSLFFKIIPGKNGVVSGKKGSPIGTKSLSFEIVKSIQISDLDANFYKIFMGYPGNAESLEYNYGTDTNWKTLKDVRLRDTVKIKNGGRCTVYKYISVCSDSTPRHCGEQRLVTEKVTLGSPHILTCTGSGAPYLDVMWTRDKATVPVWSSTYDNTTADHQISSKVEIDNITLDHLGEWICTIRNKNFGDSVNKKYVLQYSNPVILLDSPNLEYYKDNENDTEFEWTVEGWPLEQVKLECGNENISVKKNDTGYRTFIPPRVGFKIILRNETVINCVLKDGNKVLNTRNITRVGYNCTEGEGGVGKDCEECEPGQTSVAGVGECFAGNSSCTEGNWGIDGICNPCPDNQTSSYHAVKPQECFTPAPEPTVPPAPDKNLIAPIAGGAGGFVAVLIMTAVLCLILRRKKPKELLVGQPLQPRFTGTAEINAVYSDDPVQRTIPRLLSDLDDSECTYANMNETLTRNNCKSKDKENTSQQFNSTDRSLMEMTAMASRSLEVEEDTPYANLDEVKRVHSTDKDEKGEESTLARLERPETGKRANRSGKMSSKNGGDGLKEDPLYAVIIKEEGNPKAYPNIRVGKTGNDNGQFKANRNMPIEEEDDTYACVELSDSSKLRTIPTVPVEDEDDTYACVELSDSSKLRTKPTVPVTNNERAEYSTMSELQRQKSYEKD